MKNLQLLFVLGFCIAFVSCKDTVNTSPRMCEYELTFNPITDGLDEDGDPCEIDIDFYFVSESGEEFTFSYDAASEDPPSWTLPAGTTFDMWIVDTGYGGSAACGDYHWDISINGEPCKTLVDYIEERPDVIVEHLPKYTISTGSCQCPTWSSIQ